MKMSILFILGTMLVGAGIALVISDLTKKEPPTILTERGYRVYQVYFSKGDGPGTLKHAMKQEGPMQILFEFYEGNELDLDDENTICPTNKSQIIKQ